MAGFVTGKIKILLQLEGFCILSAAVFFYGVNGFSWKLFLLAFFIPDLAFAGYLLGARIGAVSYNISHSYIGAIITAAIAIYFNNPYFLSAALIWFAHIGFDRMLGYGLKYGEGFSYTHLGRIGKAHKNLARESAMLGN